MSKINEELTDLLKGKVIRKMCVTAFPDIIIEFENGIVLHCVCEWKRSKLTTGDEQGCILYINKKMIGKFKGRYNDITGLWTEIEEMYGQCPKCESVNTGIKKDRGYSELRICNDCGYYF